MEVFTIKLGADLKVKKKYLYQEKINMKIKIYFFYFLDDGPALRSTTLMMYAN